MSGKNCPNAGADNFVHLEFEHRCGPSFLERQGQVPFTSSNELDRLRCEISSFADFRTSSSELIRNVQDSPTKHIDAKLKGSVTRLVRKERKNITKIQLEGVTIDNTISSLVALSETLWFGTAVKAQIGRAHV